jgi:hypothetical protein
MLRTAFNPPSTKVGGHGQALESVRSEMPAKRSCEERMSAEERGGVAEASPQSVRNGGRKETADEQRSEQRRRGGSASLGDGERRARGLYAQRSRGEAFGMDGL